MTAEDESTPTTTTTTTAPAAPAAAETTKGNNKQPRPREPEVPIEELYDLSKPIPREDKPSKEALETALDALNTEMETIRTKRQTIQTKIDDALADPASKSVLQSTRTELQTVKTQKSALIQEKKALRAKLDAAKSETDKLMKDKKDVRSTIKFSSLQDIQTELAKLQRQQETTTMSLADEKKLIKEMDALQASKKHIANLKKTDVGIDSVREQRKRIQEQLKLKDAEIDACSKKMDEFNTILKAQNEKDSKKRDAISGLFAQRDTFKTQMTDKIAQKDKLRQEFREKSNKWWNYQRAVKAQRKIAYEEEKKRREEEQAALQAQMEAEEAKKIPYEEEQELCEYLAKFLERTYLKVDAGNTATKAADVVAVQNDPFAGMQGIGKKVDDAAEFFGKGKGKKKRRNREKGSTAFSISPDLMGQFSLVQLSAPTRLDQVEQAVQDLRAKKQWYKEQPRGSVPTATDIRKAAQKRAPKAKTTNGTGNFSLQQDDFAPLSTAGGPVDANWPHGE